MIEVQQVLTNLSARRTENDTHERLAKKNLFAHHLSNKLISCKKTISGFGGGRGSGKTIYLKYFSHWMQLNKKSLQMSILLKV